MQPDGPWSSRPAGGGYSDLSPLTFLLRSARVFAERVAVRQGVRTLTYRGLLAETERVAGAIAEAGVTRGDRVALLLPNSVEMLEAHFAVPGAGAVAVPINTRLSAGEIAAILEHSGACCLLFDEAFAEVARAALDRLDRPPTALEVTAQDKPFAASAPRRALEVPEETALLSINYTSGTTGRPKGVMYTHRGAFLHALGVVAECRLSPRTRYVWTLPMFHCHGWAFPWAVTAVGGRHLCLRDVRAEAAWETITAESATHFCGAPTVLEMLLESPAATPVDGSPIEVFTGGAPPSPATIERGERLGWNITHLYGLTETYGPIGVCVWHPEWDVLDRATQARLKARQGVESVVSMPLEVVDDDLRPVPANGETTGEIVMTGNNVTIGYYRDPDATAEAFRGDVFHSGDAAVIHPDGYVEICDRLKDVIISGGENVSSIEVEHALAQHPDVAQAAVIGMPHEKWGESPWAFVVPRDRRLLSEQELRAFAREHLAGFKLPSRIITVGELPTTSTGKVQKFRLRELADASTAA